MHTLAAGAIVGSVKKRIAQGDCPTEKAFGVETLEGALMEVHRLFEAEQREREKLEAALDQIADYCGNRGAAIQSVRNMALAARGPRPAVGSQLITGAQSK